VEAGEGVVSWSWAKLTAEATGGVNCRLAPDPGRVEESDRHQEDDTDLACRCCGTPPHPQEVGGFDLVGWRCDACLKAAGLLFAADGLGSTWAAAERALAGVVGTSDDGELIAGREALP
jgi:hypothetical protein